MKKTYIKYIAALIIFGSNGAVASMADTESYETVFIRTLIGSLFLAAVLFISSLSKSLKYSETDMGNGNNKNILPCGKLRFFVLKIHAALRKEQKAVLYTSLSGAAMGMSWILLFEAYDIIGVGVSSVLYYCGPVIVMALSPLIFGERLFLKKVFGFAAVIAGAFSVNFGLGETLGAWAVFCGLASAFMYAVMVIFNKKAGSDLGMAGQVIQLFSAFLTVFIFLAIKGGLIFEITKGSFIHLAILGIFNTGIGCLLYFSSISRLPVQTVAICGYLEPLSALLFSVLLLGESISHFQFLGAVLVLGGAFYAEFSKNREPVRQ